MRVAPVRFYTGWFESIPKKTPSRKTDDRDFGENFTNLVLSPRTGIPKSKKIYINQLHGVCPSPKKIVLLNLCANNRYNHVHCFANIDS